MDNDEVDEIAKQCQSVEEARTIVETTKKTRDGIIVLAIQGRSTV